MIRALLPFCAFLLGCGGSAPPEFWAFEPEHLQYRPESSISFSSKPAFTGPGGTRAVRGNHEWRGQTLPNPGQYFEAIDSGEKAIELCELSLWGTRVDSADQLSRVLEAYEGHGFPVADPGTSEECRRGEAERRFDVRVTGRPDGYDVALTAFVLPEGMGARAKLARFHYRVGRDGQITLEDEDLYLEGPYLNWQTAFVTFDSETGEERKKRDEFLEEDRQKYEKRQKLIRAVYERTARALPPGRP